MAGQAGKAEAVATTAVNQTRQVSIVAMDTVVTAMAVTNQSGPEIDKVLQQALAWFDHVERVCSRFDTDSEVYRLAQTAQRPVAVSPLLFEAINFSLEVAAASDGRFDPTIGGRQAARGFDRNYVSGQHVTSAPYDPTASYQDIALDAEQQTVLLRKPLLIDLGAVAKGLAIDLAAKDLSQLKSFSIDAGGDLYVKGRNEEGEPWRVGIEHPREDGLIATLKMEKGAICTSGDYARRRAGSDEEHHLLDPKTDHSPRDIISCTVIAPTAMAADALSTAAFVAGNEAGLRLLEGQGVDGMLVKSDLSVSMTSGFDRWLA